MFRFVLNALERQVVTLSTELRDIEADVDFNSTEHRSFDESDRFSELFSEFCLHIFCVQQFDSVTLNARGCLFLEWKLHQSVAPLPGASPTRSYLLAIWVQKTEDNVLLDDFIDAELRDYIQNIRCQFRSSVKANVNFNAVIYRHRPVKVESNEKTQSVCEYWFYFKELTNRDLPKINRKIIVERDDPTVGYESSMNALSSDCTYRHMENIDLSFYKIIINC